MSTFGDSVRHGLRNLVEFRGRDNRARFWPFAGVVVGVVLVVGNAVSVVLFVLTAVLVQRTSTDSLDSGEPVFAVAVTAFMVVTAAGAAATIVLLAAAVTRRLHDRDLRGAWALVPVLLLGTAFTFFARLIGTFEEEPDPLLFAAGFINNLVYLASVVALTWQLARAGSPGDNRFGPPALR